MHIPFYERVFMVLSVAVLVAFFVAIVVASAGLGVRLPEPVGRVDPQRLTETPPFDRPGVRAVGPNRYEVVMVARAWRFEPREVEVPVGSTVTFRIASADVTHGFLIRGTDANLTLIPGQVSEVTVRFDRPGEYLFLCHEYCGIGHHAMYGKVVVR